jgi:chromatin remodeling complex protein RSC6
MKAGTTKTNANTEPLGTCVTDTSVIPSSSSAIHRHPPQNVSNGDEVTSDDSDSDKSDSSYGAQSNAKAEALPPKNRKRAANGVSKATSQPTESISDEDMASVVKRRRGTRTKQRREVQKKDQRKSTVKEDSKKSSGKKKTAYGRVCVLSDDLANLIGKRYMRRSDVVLFLGLIIYTKYAVF